MQRLKRIPFIFLLGIVVISWLHQSYYDFEHDDAYISYRYAKNWAEGWGPVFNKEERVEGYTNFLFMGVLTLGKKVGLEIGPFARNLGTLACFGLIFLVYFFSLKILKRNSSYGLAVAAGIALHAGLAVWSRSGMETVFFTFFAFLAHFRFLAELEKKEEHYWCSGLLFSIVALIRADGFIFCGIAFLFLVVERAKPKAFFSLVGSFLLLFLPYFLWRWHYYGYLLPNTFYAKTGGGFYQQIRGIFYSYKFISAFGGALLFALPLLLLILKDTVRNKVRLYLGMVLSIWISYVVYVGGDHMPMSRFFIPLIPLFLFLFLEVAFELGQKISLEKKWQKGTIGFLFIIILISGVFPSLNRRRFPYVHVIMNKVLLEQWKGTGYWMKEHFKPDTYVALKALGAMSYLSELKALDMLGLTEPTIAHLKVGDMGKGTAGHEKTDFDYVLSRKPDIIIENIVETPIKSVKKTYSDGSVYLFKTSSLGKGPTCNFFGEIEYKELYLLYYERENSH